MNVLFATTSADSLGPGNTTGLWLDEFTVPYMALSKAGAKISVASPKGGPVPIDPKSIPSEAKRAKWYPALIALLNTRKLSEMSAEGFDAIFVPGGHGPMIDLTHDANLHRLVAELDANGKVVAALCHGAAALLNVRKADGYLFLEGRRVSGFTALEERMVGLEAVVPFMLEDALKLRGANFSSALLPFIPYVVRDGNLITGQNPASTAKITVELLAALRSARPARASRQLSVAPAVATDGLTAPNA
jgi:putative intracellular protease/amidase